MTVLKTYARVFVDDLDLSLPLFEHVAGRPADLRVDFEEAELAAVGDILLIAAPPEARERYRDVLGPLVVSDVEAVVADLLERGAAVDGEFSAATGHGSYVRHPDGVVVEYLQWNDDIVALVLGEVSSR